MWIRLIAVGVWVLVAASAVAWGLRFKPEPLSAPAPVTPSQPEDAPASGRVALQRLLGASQPVGSLGLPEAGSRFKLLGVIADYAGHGRGVALIAVDDKPARSFRVGARVDGDLLLQSVAARSARLGGKQGAALVTLELPNPASLPVRAGSGAAALPGLAVPAPVPVAAGVPAPVPGPAPAASLPVPPTPVLAQLPSARMAAPGEMVSPGRRQRLRSRDTGQAPEAP